MRTNNIAVKGGTATVNYYLKDRKGKVHVVTLEDALYVPSYKQDVFSVQAAIECGASIKFVSNSGELIAKDGTLFDIEKLGRLYYLNTAFSVNASDCKNHDA